MNKTLSFTEEERKILDQAFDIIEELTDEANDFNHDEWASWSAKKMKYHFDATDFIYNGEEMEKFYDILCALADTKEVFFSIEKD